MTDAQHYKRVVTGHIRSAVVEAIALPLTTDKISRRTRMQEEIEVTIGS